MATELRGAVQRPSNGTLTGKDAYWSEIGSRSAEATEHSPRGQRGPRSRHFRGILW